MLNLKIRCSDMVQAFSTKWSVPELSFSSFCVSGVHLYIPRNTQKWYLNIFKCWNNDYVVTSLPLAAIPRTLIKRPVNNILQCIVQPSQVSGKYSHCESNSWVNGVYFWTLFWAVHHKSNSSVLAIYSPWRFEIQISVMNMCWKKHLWQHLVNQ